MEKYENILKEDLFLQALKQEGIKGVLTGGAINDILDGKIPKDYDFIHTDELEKLMKTNPKFIFKYISSTAITYEFLGKQVQLLFKNTSKFPYTIEQSKLSILDFKLSSFDFESFESKILIPNKEVFKSRAMAKNVLRRLLHWTKKGYSIPDITYQAVLKSALKNSKSNSSSEELEDEES